MKREVALNLDFASIIELVQKFSSEDICVKHLETIRWNDTIVSPFDTKSTVYLCANGRYKCRNTGRYFNVRTGTLFDNTKIKLQTWFLAIYLITSHKKGISSVQLGKDLNVTQKTAWFMLHRIRNCFGLDEQGNEVNKLGGNGEVVEVDETIVGGKVSNKSTKYRKSIADKKLDPMDNKTMVMGFVERGGELRFKVIQRKLEIRSSVKENVSGNAHLITDTNGSYMGDNFAAAFPNHDYIDHSIGEYAKGRIYTNTIEGAFSLFDRGVIGIYHYVSPKHLQKYVNEFSYRYNTRKTTESNRFNNLLSLCAKRLNYQTLIQK